MDIQSIFGATSESCQDDLYDTVMNDTMNLAMIERRTFKDAIAPETQRSDADVVEVSESPARWLL